MKKKTFPSILVPEELAIIETIVLFVTIETYLLRSNLFLTDCFFCSIICGIVSYEYSLHQNLQKI